MYDYHLARTRTARRTALRALSALIAALLTAQSSPALAQDYESASVIRKISGASEKLELTTNTSRILTLDKNIPRVQVNNPELVAVTPLSAKDVQISAKKAGVTQINLWDEDGKIHTVDVLIYGDARELTVALQTQFPHSTIRVYRYSESLVLTGFVDNPEHVGPIMRLAEDYAPKVINNINVGGVQQVLLKVKVMEISRTKLRQLGVDWAWFGGGGDFAVNRVNNLISEFSTSEQSIETLGDTFSFGIISDNAAFFGVLDALQSREVAKILAEPNLVAISGRPAQFNVGGEVPILIPQSLGTSSIEFKPFGTQVDFLPLVLGNGNIRLEVRPRISFLDPTNGIELNEIRVPGFNVRQVDTAVEMKAGQTFALAGLVQERTESRNRGLPYLSDVPIIGVPFRRTRDEVDEIELLILVTPEFVDPIDACETPCGGPGYATVSPTNRQLYCAGHVEVPAHCNPTQGLTACGQDPCGPCNNCAPCGNGAPVGEPMPMITDGVSMPGGTGYDDSNTITDQHPGEAPPESMPAPRPMPNVPDDLRLPAEPEQSDSDAPGEAYFQPWPSNLPPAGSSQSSAPGPYSPPRQPVFMRNASRPHNPPPAVNQPANPAGENRLIGPVGYDLQ
jgi:pilus assembly protein CpaC